MLIKSWEQYNATWVTIQYYLGYNIILSGLQSLKTWRSLNSINKIQSIIQTSIAPISPAKPGSVAWQPNQCSTAKSRKQFRNINRPMFPNWWLWMWCVDRKWLYSPILPTRSSFVCCVARFSRIRWLPHVGWVALCTICTLSVILYCIIVIPTLDNYHIFLTCLFLC